LVILLAFVFRVWSAPSMPPSDSQHGRRAPQFAAAFVATVMLMSAAHYLRIEGRLLYAKWSEGAMRASSLPALRGLRVRGEWLPGFDELVAWTGAHVPRGDAMLFIPAEDLFYFATGRRPPAPV